MPYLLPTNLPTIMQAVEQQLLNFVSTITSNPIAGDISNIYWVFEEDEPPPGQTGQRDILLIQREDDTEGTVVGGGRFAWIASGLDINLRSSYAVDRHGSRKQWMITNRLLMDGMMDALMGFFPEDANLNALTIEGFVLDKQAKPVKDRKAATWGKTVATYRFHYLPNINTALL